jgi:hypothetical protein
MGRVRWAEWLAFMQSRGLEWGKPLSDEAPNAPALRQHRLAQLRQRYVSSLDDNGDDQDNPCRSLETAGNLICLPGVRLADVLGSDPNDGGRS